MNKIIGGFSGGGNFDLQIKFDISFSSKNEEKLNDKEILERSQDLFNRYCRCGNKDKSEIAKLLKEAKLLAANGPCVLYYAEALFLNIAILAGDMRFYKELRQYCNVSLISKDDGGRSPFKNLLESDDKGFIVAVVKYELGFEESKEDFLQLMPAIRFINAKDDYEISLFVEYMIAIENKDIRAFDGIFNQTDGDYRFRNQDGKKVFYYFTENDKGEYVRETYTECNSRFMWDKIKDSFKNKMLQDADKLWMYLYMIEPAFTINLSKLLKDNKDFRNLFWECFCVPGGLSALFEVIKRLNDSIPDNEKNTFEKIDYDILFNQFFKEKPIITAIVKKQPEAIDALIKNLMEHYQLGEVLNFLFQLNNGEIFFNALENIILHLIKDGKFVIFYCESLFSMILSMKDSKGLTILCNGSGEAFVQLMKAVISALVKIEGVQVSDFESFCRIVLQMKTSKGCIIMDAYIKAFFKLIQVVLPDLIKLEGVTVKDFEAFFSMILSMKDSTGITILDYDVVLTEFLELLEAAIPTLVKIKGTTLKDFEVFFSMILSMKGSSGITILDYNKKKFMYRIPSEAFLKLLEAVIPALVQMKGVTVKDFEAFFSMILSMKGSKGITILDYGKQVFLKLMEEVIPMMVKIEGISVGEFEQFFCMVLDMKDSNGWTILDSYTEELLDLLQVVDLALEKIKGG